MSEERFISLIQADGSLSKRQVVLQKYSLMQMIISGRLGEGLQST